MVYQMLVEIERSRPETEVSELLSQSDQALKMWEERRALVDPAALSHELSELLDEVAGGINDWGQDRRDAALSLIQALATRPESLPILNGDQQAAIGKSYVGVVEKLTAQTDWLGGPWTAMEVGHSVAAILGKEIDFVYGMRLRGQLAEAWSNYAARVSFKEVKSGRSILEERLYSNSLRPQLDVLQSKFLSRDADAEAGLEQRNGPRLDGSERELAIWYGQNTRAGQSAKLDVLRATPNYLKSVTERGVDIANFWNLNDPEKANAATSAVLNHPVAAAIFNERFIAKTGSAYDSTTDYERRALGDLNIGLAREVLSELHMRRKPYETVLSRILQQVEEAQELDQPRAKLKPILKWIRQIDPDFSSYDPAEVQAFINAHDEQLRAHHEAKFAGIDQALQDIEVSLPSQSNVVRFMDRSLYDLKSANLTGDCTAWNLECGFNAWTVPVWVTNPNFNFAYIYSGNQMVAKFGMILAFGPDNKPQVIIDSIETNKNLPKFEEANGLMSIYAGFVELQQWADRNNFGTLQVCTYTNSQELTAELPIVKNGNGEEDLPYDGLVYDGMLASEELLKSISDLEPSGVYLQSSAIQHDEDGNIVHGEYTFGAEVFEEIAKEALKAATESGESLITSQNLAEILRSGDDDKIMRGILEALTPEFAAAFEFDYKSLVQLYNNCREYAEEVRYSMDKVFDSLMLNIKLDLQEDFRARDPIDEMDWSLLDDYDYDYSEGSKLTPEEEKIFQAVESGSIVPATNPLLPKGFSVLDYRALVDYLDGPENLKVLNILDALVLPGIDLEAAAIFVFGREGEPQEQGLVIPIASLPRYDRREMAAEKE